ncbi:MAG: hypothetical protein JWR16_2199 [Nevskia sp.]|nr:hypothetical protein [Nevskia sp.]
MNRTCLRLAATALCFFVLLGGGRALAAPCADTVDLNSPVLANGFAANLANTRNNPSAITSANVADLQLALTPIAKGEKEKRGAPAVTQQAVFLSAGRDIVAINRLSGCRYWSYSIPYRTTLLVGSNAVRSSAIYYLNEGGGKPALVLAGDFYGNYYALNAKTGALVWKRFVGTDAERHFVTGAPQFYAGKLLVPISTKEVLTAELELPAICCKGHGMLQAIDPYTGAAIWSYHTARAATYDTTVRHYTPNGMSIWGTPAVDVARGVVYIGTGQNLTRPTTDNSDSVIALDLNTGVAKWVFQATANDAFNVACDLNSLLLRGSCTEPIGPDWDFGAPPILVQLADGTQTVVAGAKNGVLYALNPDTGALKWSRRLGAGGTLGGIHWGMAADAQNVYAAVSDVTVNKASGLAIGVKSAITQVANATPGLYAVDFSSGALKWAVHPTHLYQGTTVDSIYSAALSVTNDVLFAGSLDGVVKAFRTTDGAELWSYDTVQNFVDGDGNKGNGGGIDSVGAIAAGTDLLVNSGYSTFGNVNQFQAGAGNALLIFRLPGS